jgi:hypothetical protein
MTFDGFIAGWAVFGGIGISEVRPTGVVTTLMAASQVALNGKPSVA